MLLTNQEQVFLEFKGKERGKVKPHIQNWHGLLGLHQVKQKGNLAFFTYTLKLIDTKVCPTVDH